MTASLVTKITELLEKIEDKKLVNPASDKPESFLLLEKVIYETQDYWDGYRTPRYVDQLTKMISKGEMMSNFNKKIFEKEELEKFANSLVKVFKEHYGIDIRYGNLNFVYHQGICRSVTLEARNRICSFKEQLEQPLIKFAKKVS